MKWVAIVSCFIVCSIQHCLPPLEKNDIDALVCRLVNHSTACEVVFSPDNNPRALLCSFIDNEQEKILIAVYCFTDSIIAQHLIDAHNRGVLIEIITNPSCIASEYHKMDMLADAGIATYIYNPDYAKQTTRFYKSIMHHKFALFSCTSKKLNIIWTGSLNFTRSACTINQENSVIIKDTKLTKKYEKQFKLLKKRATKYKMRYYEPKIDGFFALCKRWSAALASSASSLSVIIALVATGFLFALFL
ncbi:MAG TPA: phospholipase D-like domain-containing protein [Candidatus Bathyarchaeia archaeon]|nr:phospholipase D-like domain-containing protein [Candidatus Bathyarchaeia archaeon]